MVGTLSDIAYLGRKYLNIRRLHPIYPENPPIDLCEKTYKPGTLVTIKHHPIHRGIYEVTISEIDQEFKNLRMTIGKIEKYFKHAVSIEAYQNHLKRLKNR